MKLSENALERLINWQATPVADTPEETKEDPSTLILDPLGCAEGDCCEASHD